MLRNVARSALDLRITDRMRSISTHVTCILAGTVRGTYINYYGDPIIDLS